MTDIPDDIMGMARDLSLVGCGCENADEAEFLCGHWRDHNCRRPADYIARAIMAERDRSAAGIVALRAENAPPQPECKHCGSISDKCLWDGPEDYAPCDAMMGDD